jgi:hypothetical protein
MNTFADVTVKARDKEKSAHEDLDRYREVKDALYLGKTGQPDFWIEKGFLDKVFATPLTEEQKKSYVYYKKKQVEPIKGTFLFDPTPNNEKISFLKITEGPAQLMKQVNETLNIDAANKIKTGFKSNLANIRQNIINAKAAKAAEAAEAEAGAEAAETARAAATTARATATTATAAADAARNADPNDPNLDNLEAAAADAEAAAAAAEAAAADAEAAAGNNASEKILGGGGIIKCKFSFELITCEDVEQRGSDRGEIIFKPTGIIDINNVTISSEDESVPSVTINKMEDMADQGVTQYEKEIFRLVTENNFSRNNNEFLKLLSTEGLTKELIDNAITQYVHHSGPLREYISKNTKAKILMVAAPKIFQAIDAALKAAFPKAGGRRRRTLKHGGKKTKRRGNRSNRRRSGRRGKRMSRR